MKSKILMILMLTFALCAPMFAQAASGSPPNFAENVQTDKNQKTVPITVDDLKIFRQITAERDSLLKECDELKRQCEKWKESAGNWQQLYEKEKYRADIVQEKRITELKNAVDRSEQANFTLNAANSQMHIQHREDMSRIGKLEFDNKKLKSDRWKWGLTGFSLGAGTGFAGGFYVGNGLAPPNLLTANGIRGLAGNRLASFKF